MTLQEVLSLLEENKNERGIESFKKLSGGKGKSYGLGLTQLKKLAKKVGRNHDLAIELWQQDIYDCKAMACLIDEPKKVTREQIEKTLADSKNWMLSHVFVQNVLSKVPYHLDLFNEWHTSKDEIKRRSAYGMLYYIAQSNKTLEDSFFEEQLDIIEKNLQQEENYVRDTMNNAVWLIGQRNKKLNARALEVTQNVGKVYVDYGDNSCEAIDCVKHLTSDRIKKKVGLM